jgi:poly(A) polymerase
VIDNIFRLFRECGEELYLVGGYVRDRLLGVKTDDLDFATSAKPEVTKRLLETAGFRTIPIGMEYGTVAAVIGSSPLELQVTTYRCSESYQKGSRHPDVIFGGSLEEDLKRRDFTINAIAMDENSRIIDPLGGQRDLRDSIIRTPLSPEETFREDPLRMLRAFRFACHLGFNIEENTLDAIGKEHSRILDISRERWKMEMDSLLTAEDGDQVARVLQMMKVTGILQEMIPPFKKMFIQDGMSQGKAHCGDIWEHTLGVVKNTAARNKCLRWAALLHDVGKAACRSVDENEKVHYYGHEKTGSILAGEIADGFRFSKRERKCLSILVKNHMRPVLYSSEWSDRAVRKLAAETGEHLDILLDLASADIASHAGTYALEGAERMADLRKRLRAVGQDTRRRVLPKELGAVLVKSVCRDSPSDAGVILSNLEELVLDGTLPEMASPGVYLDYLAGHPEIRENQIT